MNCIIHTISNIVVACGEFKENQRAYIEISDMNVRFLKSDYRMIDCDHYCVPFEKASDSETVDQSLVDFLSQNRKIRKLKSKALLDKDRRQPGEFYDLWFKSLEDFES